MIIPIFSIIIPTYNSAKSIRNCLNSILTQDFKNYEIIVQDGMSTDETIAIIKGIKKQYPDNTIYVFEESDKNVYDAMNKGIKEAKGEWLYFLGSDDYLYDNNLLTNIKNTIEQNKGKYQLIYGNVSSSLLGNKYDGEFDKKKILQKNICHQAIFYSKKIFKIKGLYDIKYKIAADYVLNLNCFFDKTVKIKYVDFTVAYFTDGGLSSIEYDNAFHSDQSKLIKKIAYKDLSLKALKSYCSSNKEFISLVLKRISYKIIP